MTCSCTYRYGGEPNRIESVVVRKARKVHYCVECQMDILPGELYRYTSGLSYDHDWFSAKTCLSCASASGLLCDGWPFGQMWEEIEYSLGECGDNKIPWSLIGKLLPDARKRVCEYIESIWERRYNV